jgi:hypothetical protein
VDDDDTAGEGAKAQLIDNKLMADVLYQAIITSIPSRPVSRWDTQGSARTAGLDLSGLLDSELD